MAKTKIKKRLSSEHVHSTKTNVKKPLNPFEVHINKEKLRVLGKKQKNDRGLPGVSRAKAINKRKGTLLQEYKLRDKSNKFLDKRIGEKNHHISEEERTMARYTAVRVKENRKRSIFNLADDEVLTHHGQTLGEIEKFEDPRSDDEDSLVGGDEGRLGSGFVAEAHFGGGTLTKTAEDGARTYKDVIDQLIAESKKRKFEQQRDKEATLELTEKLDSEWKDLMPLVKEGKKPEDEYSGGKPSVDDYDKVMRELRFEARGTVSDRLKTEDEIAKEEKEKLEQLEIERLQRMRGGSRDEPVQNHRSADDLDDGIVYEEDPEYMLSYNEEGESNVKIDVVIQKNDSDNEENGSDGEDNSSEDDSEDVHSDLKASDSENEEEEELQISSPAEGSIKASDVDSTKAQDTNDQSLNATEGGTDLPYVFSLPDSYESLKETLENQTAAKQNIIIERMVKCNHPSLAEGNKEKLELLFTYILRYLLNLFKDCKDISRVKKCFEVFNKLTPHIHKLAEMSAENAHKAVLGIVTEKYGEFKLKKKQYPGLDVLAMLKLIGGLFSTSDFRHQIVTPSFIFIEQMLNKCQVRSRRDVSYGLFLVTLVHEYTKLSNRYLPASINFLCGLLHSAVPKSGVKLIKVLPPFKSTSSLLVVVENQNSTPFPSLKMDSLDLVQDEFDETFKVRVVYTTVKLLQNFFVQFKDLPSNLEIFQLALEYLKLIPVAYYPKEVVDCFVEFEKLTAKAKEEKKLNYLVREAKKPKALRLYEPKIVEIYDRKSHKVQSKEKAERAKLLHKLKQEKKGALREIRRDNTFLGRVKIQQQIKIDKERREKVKRIYAEAASQQSELNAIDRKKKKK